MEKVIYITGMHCRSCEILIEHELSKIPGVTQARVYHSKGLARISYKHRLDMTAIEIAVQKAGYKLGSQEKVGYFSRNLNDYRELGTALIIITIIYIAVKNLGLFHIADRVRGNYSSLPVVFFIGVTAGISTCMALVGGLVLGASARFSENHPSATRLEKFTPHIFFNLGRIGSYFVLGGVIGLIGSFFRLSTSVLGLLTILVGMVMLLMGGQLIEIFPFLKKFSFTVPKSISRFFGLSSRSESAYSHSNSVVLGALTFFLPCGFTQAMQLYAMSTGSPVAGALTMGVFAVGTTPGLLGVGGLTAVVKGQGARLFFKTAGLVVLVLGIYNISNGLNLTGLKFSSPPPVARTDNNFSSSLQILHSSYSNNTDMTPNNFTVKANQPVRLDILAQDDGRGCMGSVTVPGLVKKTEFFSRGETVSFKFTPTRTGTYKITCAMGIPHGEITVI